MGLLKQCSDLVQQLTRYRTILRGVLQIRVDILSLICHDLHASRASCEQHGLMVNDSLIIVVMQREGIVFLATNDPDFGRVPGLAVCVPTP